MGYDFAINARKQDAVDHVLRTHSATVHAYGRTDRGTVNSRHLWFVDDEGLIHLALLKSDRGSWGLQGHGHQHRPDLLHVSPDRSRCRYRAAR